jgi:hypothetical protein
MSSKTVKDLTEHFGVGEYTILHWIASGQLKAALEEFELVRTHTAPPPRAPRRKGQEAITEFIK